MKMSIKTLNIAGIDEALYGMRHPMNSWHLGDTRNGVIGDADMKLARKLIIGGSEHAKYLRQIQVWADINMPRYWWSEFDTYHFNSKNSCSTMHRLLHSTTMITLDSFEYDKEDEDFLIFVIGKLNELRQLFLETTSAKDKNKLVKRAKALLPDGFLQLRMVNTNYAELRNIYHQRKYHRLHEEWVDVFCSWVETLPYAEELIIQ